MGLIVDTNVFIAAEHRGAALDLSFGNVSDNSHISVVTAAELLMGVHRADNEARRSRRSTFVEAIFKG